jgi:hypothetical protein
MERIIMRTIWHFLYMTGEWSKGEVEHVNGI